MPAVVTPASLANLGRASQGLPSLLPQATAAQLSQLLKNALPAIGEKITKSEAAWLRDLASHPNADGDVKRAIKTAVAARTLASNVQRTAFGGFVDGLSSGPALTPTIAPVSTGGGQGSSTLIGVQAGGPVPANVNTLDVVHFQGPSTYPGDFKIKPAILTSMYGDVPADKFGTTEVQVAPGVSHLVHDMQYDLGDGKVGMRFIPVADKGGTVKDKDGHNVPGSKLMDDFIRKESGLKPEDPIWALVSYVHPEAWQGDMKSLGGEKLKTEMGNTHLAAYKGDGDTVNSPWDYHNHTWELIDGTGYPGNVTLVGLAGVDQATLNRSMRNKAGVLNHGVLFPSNYKEDIYRTIDLPTTMLFYRDWLLKEPYQKTDNSWKMYCAEHGTEITNVGLNLPDNEKAYREMFGDAVGAKAWSAFKLDFKREHGRDFTAADQTDFLPLWKQEGMKLTDAQPWKDVAEYNAYDSARRTGAMATYTGRVPPPPGKGLAWPPETTADLMCDFVESYASFKQGGGFLAASAIMGFKGTITDRMGISSEKFTAMTVPVINKMMVAEAMATAPGTPADAWMKKASATLFAAFGGASAPPAAAPQIQGLVDMCLKAVSGQIQQIAASPVPDAATAREKPHAWLRNAIQSDIEAARHLSVSDASKVEFYSPPAVVNRVVLGMHEKSKLVSVRTIATAIEGSHMEPK